MESLQPIGRGNWATAKPPPKPLPRLPRVSAGEVSSASIPRKAAPGPRNAPDSARCSKSASRCSPAPAASRVSAGAKESAEQEAGCQRNSSAAGDSGAAKQMATRASNRRRTREDNAVVSERCSTSDREAPTDCCRKILALLVARDNPANTRMLAKPSRTLPCVSSLLTSEVSVLVSVRRRRRLALDKDAQGRRGHSTSGRRQGRRGHSTSVRGPPGTQHFSKQHLRGGGDRRPPCRDSVGQTCGTPGTARATRDTGEGTPGDTALRRWGTGDTAPHRTARPGRTASSDQTRWQSQRGAAARILG